MILSRTVGTVTAVVLVLVAAGCAGGDAPQDGARVEAVDTAASPPTTGTTTTTATTGSGPATSALAQASPRTQVIEVEMDEFAFRPDRIEVAAGDTVELRFVNTGTQVHDAFVGTVEEQQEHSEEMAHDDGHAHHTSNDAVTVDPGGTATITKTFDAPAVLEIGCHQPGHYESGMRLSLTVG